MFKHLKYTIILPLICLLFSSFILVPRVMAVPGDYGLRETTGVTGKNLPTLGKDSIASKIGSLVGTVLSFVGVIFLILMIVGGLMWMTAGGTETQVTKAKSLITQAIIGLIIVMSAYALVSFIGGAVGPAPK